MDELSPEARRTLMAARADVEPTGADRARIQGLLIAAIAAPAATAAAATSVGTKVAATGSGLFAHLNVVVLAGTVALGGGYAAHVWHGAQSTERATTSAASSMIASSAIEVASSPAPTEPTNIRTVAADNAPAVAHATPTARRHVAQTSTHLAKEVAWVGRAESALKQGAPAAALRSLAEHARRYPHGELEEERLGLRAVALCSLAETAAAAVTAHNFLTRYPRALMAPRVRAACADTMRAGAK